MYLPGFPAIAADLHSTVAHVSLSLSSFFIGISAGQFLYGPLLDRFGRKRPLYVGLLAYLLATIGCALARSVDALIALRLLQALGGCVGMVASRAMVRDMFDVKDNAKVFSLLMLVIGVSPLVAPTLGGYLTAAFGWQSVFVVLSLLVAAILAAVHFTLPESRKPDTSLSLKPRPILLAFVGVQKNTQFSTYVFTGAIASAGLYAYIAGSPTVFMEIFKVTERQYGWIFAFIAIGLIVSSQLNSLVLRRYKSEAIIPVALLCQTVTGGLLLVGSMLGVLGLFGTIFLIFIFLCCQGFVFPNSAALSLAPFSRNAGTASALMGGLQMAIGAFTSALVSFLNNHPSTSSGQVLPMAGVMAGCAFTSFCILLIGRRVIRYKAGIKAVKENELEMIEKL